MSFTLHGMAVSPGIAIGYAHLVSHATLEVSHFVIPARHIDAEIARFDAAVETVRVELDTLRNTTAAAPAEIAAFVDLHAMILADPLLSSVPRDLIRSRRCNAEWALVQQMEQLVEQFEGVEDTYLRERKADVVQVAERVLRALLGRPGHLPARRAVEYGTVVVAHDLSPADTIQFRQQHVSGFITDLGGATSHTAIVARSLKIPALVGMHHARQIINDDDLLIVDGTLGVLIVDPDQRVLDEYRLRKSELELERNKLKRLVSARSATLDGVEVSLQANIELPEDVGQAREVDAAGVGLYRTEFLFLNREDLPDEEEQFEAYRSVAQAMGGRPVTSRTLDIGADKALLGDDDNSPNPALGLRAIRYCLAEPDLFLTQLRALLRAAHYGDVRMLIPMLAHAREVDEALNLLARAKAQLHERRVKFNADMQVGGMIEIPAAALAVGLFLRRLDFLSIGTNDLIQYTLAIDRTDDNVAHLYDPLHPGVLRLIAHTIDAGGRAGVPVAVCGEMAGNPAMTRLLLGMGLRQFSMPPGRLLEVKQGVLRSDCSRLRPAVVRMLRQDEPEKLLEHLDKLNA
ncbi:MAG: phosphoenolpyruvate--protein phosphotransferase [Betaproteobacteria bacterium]|nr:phosphoenolpyruvate--protein phosphotransferase [Betaproteobacteria bacterium]